MHYLPQSKRDYKLCKIHKESFPDGRLFLFYLEGVKCMQLVIAEKPSVGAALAKALGACEKKKGFIEGDNLISPMKLYVNT